MSLESLLRDPRGLLTTGVTYAFDNMGRINWRAMVPPEYLYLKPECETEVIMQQGVKTKWDVDVTKCKDEQLLITLPGLKALAHIRGIRFMPPPILHVSPTEVSCSCSIEFEPNFENPHGLTSSGAGTASLYSVSGKFQLYLASMAHNRALTRAIKDALRIEVLGKDEVDFKASAAFEKSLKEGNNPLVVAAQVAAQPAPAPEAAPKESHDPHGRLRQLCTEKGISFDVLKARAVEYRAELTYDIETAAGNRVDPAHDPINWTGINEGSIPRKDVYTLIGKIQDAATKKGKKAKA